MTELERLVVIMAALSLDGITGVESEDLGREADALIEVINARSESARNYQRSRRGIDALERVDARRDKRDIDYNAARAAALEV